MFDADYAEVARTLDTTPAAARQLVHRARQHVAEGRPRFDAPPERQRDIVSRFFAAVRDGDLGALREYLAADVVFAADGGGKVAAARRPVVGVEAVGHLMLSSWNKPVIAFDRLPEWLPSSIVDVNGEPALVARRGGRLDSIFVFSTAAGRIGAINVIRNPEKLAWFASHEGELASL